MSGRPSASVIVLVFAVSVWFCVAVPSIVTAPPGALFVDGSSSSFTVTLAEEVVPTV